jgi:hypothetical protein
MTTRQIKRLDELAQSVPPARDLWPAIAAAIEADKAGAAAAPNVRRYGWRPAGAMAAAVALVAVGVYIGKGMTPAGSPIVRTPGSEQVPELVNAAYRDANYRKEREELVAQVQKRLESMPVAERAKVSASLKTLSRSITEIEAALGRDPANALLQELLVSSCQEEMRALTAVREAGGQET